MGQLKRREQTVPHQVDHGQVSELDASGGLGDYVMILSHLAFLSQEPKNLCFLNYTLKKVEDCLTNLPRYLTSNIVPLCPPSLPPPPTRESISDVASQGRVIPVVFPPSPREGCIPQYMCTLKRGSTYEYICTCKKVSMQAGQHLLHQHACT